MSSYTTTTDNYTSTTCCPLTWVKVPYVDMVSGTLVISFNFKEQKEIEIRRRIKELLEQA